MRRWRRAREARAFGVLLPARSISGLRAASGRRPPASLSRRPGHRRQKATEALQVADWGYILVSGQVHVSGPASTILSRPDIGEVFLGGSSSVLTGDD